jgi:hypothetical protein
VLLANSCGQTPGATKPSSTPSAAPAAPSPAAIPSVSPPGSPLAVIATGTQAGQVVHLIDEGGHDVATATPAPTRFTGNFLAPWVSVTASRVYYLDGSSQVRWLAANGSGGLATTLTVGTAEQASFAVSPDDRRIAVSVLRYAAPVQPSGQQGTTAPPKYLGMTLYIEDLSGGNRVDLFSSAAVAEFPVGWHAGSLIVGVGPPVCCQAIPPNPYTVSTYHVVDPTTGNRISTICAPPAYAVGPPVAAGTLCKSTSSLFAQSWSGTSHAIPHNGYVDFAALSPQGDGAAIGGSQVSVVELNGTALESLTGAQVVWGWLKAGYLIVADSSGANTELVNLRTALDRGLPGASVPLPPNFSAFFGVLPGGLG